MQRPAGSLMTAEFVSVAKPNRRSTTQSREPLPNSHIRFTVSQPYPVRYDARPIDVTSRTLHVDVFAIPPGPTMVIRRSPDNCVVQYT